MLATGGGGGRDVRMENIVLVLFACLIDGSVGCDGRNKEAKDNVSYRDVLGHLLAILCSNFPSK